MSTPVVAYPHRSTSLAHRLLQWQFERVFVYGYLEPVGVVRLSHGLQPLGHALCIAVLAARANLSTAGHWIPGRFRPLY